MSLNFKALVAVFHRIAPLNKRFYSLFAGPNIPLCVAFSNPAKPNWRHTTSASLLSHSSSHTDPHLSRCRISTLPKCFYI